MKSITDDTTMQAKIKEIIARGCGCDHSCEWPGQNINECGCNEDASAILALTGRALTQAEDPFGIALILKDQTAELERLREDIAWKANIIAAADTEMERLRGLIAKSSTEPTLTEPDADCIERATEIIASGCGCHRYCEQIVGPDVYCGCEKDARAVLALRSATPTSGEREYDSDVAPCDDAEFGMKP